MWLMGTEPVQVPGGDHLIGGPGADMLDGGSSLAEGADTPKDATDDVQHIDWAVYRGAMEGVMVTLATGTTNGMGTGGEAMGDTLVNIELVWGSTHDDTFIAGSGADLIHGDSGMRHRVLRGLGDGRHREPGYR